MDHFQYRNGELCAEAVPLRRIADDVGTPFYCYSTATLERHYRVLTEALAGLDVVVCYSVKANSNLAVIATLASLGAGADVVSGGELKRALVAGVPAERIVFAGVGKTADEMAAALKAGILQINVESAPELEMLAEVATALGRQASIGIRVNPDVDAQSHAKITTGKRENKFGVPLADARELYRRAAKMKGIRVAGVAVHIGSQILSLEPFREAFRRTAELTRTLRADGHDIRWVDLGGGLGIPYEDETPPTPAEYGALVRSEIGPLGCRLIVDPGRLIAGNAGVMVSRVLLVKTGATHDFVVADAAMNDFIRPTLYNARHAIVPVTEPADGAVSQEVEVVGPVCESGDTFGRTRRLPAVGAGDLIALRTAGAYGAVMASTYNTRPLVPEVLVRNDTYAVVRERISVDDMLARETLPDWLAAGRRAKRKARR